MLLTLMRHGEPLRGAADGTDPGLSDLGLDQARRAAPYAWPGSSAAVYSSPQLRARQTAREVVEGTGLSVAVDDGLVEFDYGARYIHYDPSAPVWRNYLAGDLSPWGLTPASFHARIAEAMHRLADRHQCNEHVLAICHGGVINAWTCQVLGVPERLHVIEPGYASLHRYRFANGRWTVVSLNENADTAHSTSK